MELHDYWADYPPLHVMVRNYLGYEQQATGTADVAPEVNAIVLKSLERRAGKLKGATEQEKKIFAMQKETAKKNPPKVKRGR